ncbi:MAG TPA: alpha/beta hydrolase [Acidimicrobiales bacterium]|nr:alpha/beta hydrolase [Acidimicrobiales bacterium]
MVSDGRLPAGALVDLDPEVVAEARELAARAEAFAATQPSPHTLPVDVQRALMAAGASPRSPDTQARTVDGVPVRVMAVPDPAAVYLHLHGGGWTMGGADQQDERLWRLARDVGVTVVTVEYRLAPEHPFPAGADDCERVARWLVAAGADELGTERLLIGGESAGAHLSAVTLVRLRDAGLAGAFAGANLAYGCFDLSMTPSQRAWGDRVVVLSTPIVAWHADQLLPGLDDAARRDPGISPLHADLTGLPPALLTVGTDDPMLDDSRLLAERWPDARLDVYEGGFHAFDLMPLRMAEVATRRQHDFLRARLAG